MKIDRRQKKSSQLRELFAFEIAKNYFLAFLRVAFLAVFLVAFLRVAFFVAFLAMFPPRDVDVC